MDVSRYHRQMLLPGFGEAGQRRLANASVLIVGSGALGSVSAELLCRAGVGRLVLVDRDVVEPTNLQRQVLFDEADAEAATPKAEAARRRLAAINSEIRVEAHVSDLDHRNAEALAGIGPDADGPPVDVVVDGTDNFATRFLVNDLCCKHGLPYCYGGAVGTTGSAMCILPRTADGSAPWENVDDGEQPADLATPDLTCLLPEPPPPGRGPTCDTAGVLGPAVGMVANFQAAQCLKMLLGCWRDVERRMLQLDLWRNTLRLVDVSRFAQDAIDPADRAYPHLEGRHAERTTSLCGRNAVQIARRDRNVGRGDASTVDLQALAHRLASQGPVKHNPSLLRALIHEGEERYELSVFPDGRAIIRGTTDPARARSLYARYVGQ